MESSKLHDEVRTKNIVEFEIFLHNSIFFLFFLRAALRFLKSWHVGRELVFEELRVFFSRSLVQGWAKIKIRFTCFGCTIFSTYLDQTLEVGRTDDRRHAERFFGEGFLHRHTRINALVRVATIMVDFKIMVEFKII